MGHVLEVVSAAGGVAHRSMILAAGVISFQLGRAVRSAEILRVRRAWYAVKDAPHDVVRAVRVGGSLTAVSVARLHDLWAFPEPGLHVSVAANAARLRSEHTRFVTLGEENDNSVCLHWRAGRGATLCIQESLADSLVDSIHCQSDEYAVILIDSALNKRLVSLAELQRKFDGLPRRYRRILARADARSQAGTETLVRLRLRAIGILLGIQIQIRGAGRVDLLIGDRLVIECDGHEWHWLEDSYEKDHERDAVLVQRGYLVLRLTYNQIVNDWPRMELIIRGLIMSGDHLFSRSRSVFRP